MKIRFVLATLVLSSVLLFVTSGISEAQLTRPFGAQGLVLDDNMGHTITIETPQPGDLGYAAWVAAGGTSTWKLPIPPFPNANAGFVLPGTAAGQTLTWIPAPDGGPQGAWEPTEGGGGGGIGGAGTGTAGTIPIWSDPSTLGNSSLTDDATNLSYSGSNFQFGGSTVLTAPATGNTFLGMNSGFEGEETGSYNTALGNSAGFGDEEEGSDNNRTAVGANSYVEEDNALVLGSSSELDGENATLVGIGTTTPEAMIDIQGNWNDEGNDLLYLTNQGTDQGTVYDINGDNWTVNSNGQLVTGGYDDPLTNASVTLDNATHIAAVGGVSNIESSSESIDVLNNPNNCPYPTDVAGLLDFGVTSDAEGAYVQVDFANSYSGNQTVTLTPANALSAQNLTSFYVNVVDGNSFQVVETGEPTAGEYKFYYHVIDAGCTAQSPSGVNKSGSAH